MLGVVRENGPQECDLNWANRHQLEDEGPRVGSSIIASAGNMYSCISPISNLKISLACFVWRVPHTVLLLIQKVSTDANPLNATHPFT